MPTAAEIMGDAAAIWMPIDNLVPWGENPRRIPESAVQKVAIGMCALGYGAPGIIRAEDSRLVAGHTRRRAYLYLLDMVEKHGLPPAYIVTTDPDTGEETKHHTSSPPWIDKAEKDHPPEWFWFMKDEIRERLAKREVPVRAMDLTVAEADELALADNRLGEEAEWDQDLLAQVLQGLPQDEHLLTGFDPSELEPLLSYTAPELPPLDDGVPPPATPSGPNPTAPLMIRLDQAQRAAFEAAHGAAKEHEQRPEMPSAEFVSLLARRYLEQVTGEPYQPPEPPMAAKPAVEASTDMFDF